MSEAPGTGTATKGLDPPDPPGALAPPPRRRARRVIVTLAAVTGTLALAAATVAAAAIVAHRTPKPHVPAHPLRATVFRLRPGQCLNSLKNGIAGVHAVPCAQPHDAEIYGAFRVAGRAWQGTAALGGLARQGCQSRLSGYLNPQLDTSGMVESYAYPNEGAWQAGAHSVICEIRGTRGKLTGSVSRSVAG